MVRLRSLRVLAIAFTVITTIRAAGVAAPASPVLAADAGRFVFVSPLGSDSNPGTLLRPIRTIAHAQQLVRGLDPNMSADVTIELMSGTYRLTAPLTLDARDSGTNGHDVVWTAAPGAHPVLSGGEQMAAGSSPIRARTSGRPRRWPGCRPASSTSTASAHNAPPARCPRS